MKLWKGAVYVLSCIPALVAAFKPSNAETVTIQLPEGNISALSDGKLIHARGIPYASAERFHVSQPVTAWNGTLDCTKPAEVCPQNNDPLAVAMGPFGDNRSQSEDYLTVSVISPVGARDLPVMVWINGGAYLVGSGDMNNYQPWGLASRGIVTVGINYRLGILEYLPLPGKAPPNLGLMDQMEALRWVQRNAAAFGGNPNNVTIFGQSAGGDSSYSLLVADDTEDLFQNAILESSTLPGRLYENNRTLMTVAMAQTVESFFNAGNNPYSTPFSTILELQKKVLKVAAEYSATLVDFAPLFGSYPLPPDVEAASRIASVAKRKRIFLGTTFNEGRVFQKIFGKKVDYAPRVTREDFHVPLNALHQQIEAATGKTTPMYYFKWHPPGTFLEACHCMELPFVLGVWEDWKNAPMLAGHKEVVETLGESVKNVWAAFAKGEDLGLGKFIIDKDFKFP